MVESRNTVSQIKERITTLSIEQQNAIDLLITGISDREVAEKVGVVRQTVTKWRSFHPEFIAELGRRREEVWGFSADKIRSLLPRAIEVVEQTIDDPQNPDRLKLAVEILKQSGIIGTFKIQQVTDAMRIIEQQTPNSSWKKLDEPTESDKIEGMKRIFMKMEDSGGFR
jgi:hypothetical protein